MVPTAGNGGASGHGGSVQFREHFGAAVKYGSNGVSQLRRDVDFIRVLWKDRSGAQLRQAGVDRPQRETPIRCGCQLRRKPRMAIGKCRWHRRRLD